MTTRNHRVRFCANNLAAASASTVTVSSALSGFPGSNAVDERRWKIWKPAGNFTIDSTNNSIYINDGSDKTVTLTSANYTYSTLASHVQTQLNASSTNWTCTYSTSTNSFTIANLGSMTLRIATTTNAAWDTLGFTGGTNQTGSSFPADESRNHTDEWIKVDLGSAAEITFTGMIGPISEVFALSSSATVTIQANTMDSWASPALSLSVTRDNISALRFLDDQADTTYRWWRFKFVDRTNTIGPEGFKIAHFYLGDYTTVTSRNVASGFEKTWVDPSEISASESGSEFALERSKYLQFENVGLGFLEATERRALEQVFYDVGRTAPFYVSFDPTLANSTSLSELTRYVRFERDPVLTHVKADIYSVGLAMREVI